MSLLYNLDPTLYWVVMLPLGIALAAWALRVACRICSVEPPDTWQAIVAVVVVCIANGLLRYYLQATHTPPNLGTAIVVPLVTTVAILCISLSIGPASALMITIVEVSLCCAIYMALIMLDGFMMVALVVGLPTTSANSTSDASTPSNDSPTTS